MAHTRWDPWRQRIERWSAPVIALLLIGLVYFMGIRSERTGFVDEVLDPNLKRITRPVLNAFRSSPPKLPVLRLQLAGAQRDSLLELLDQALLNGWLEPAENRWFTAKAAVDQVRGTAWIKLLEGPMEREARDRWRMQVRPAPSDSLPLPAIFDLTPIRDAGPVYGRLFELALQDLDIPQPRRAMVEVRMDRRSRGPYLVESRADSVQLALWARGPGPLMRFDDEQRKHALRSTQAARFPIAPMLREEWLSAPVLASRSAAASAPVEQHTRSLLAMEDLRAGRAPIAELIDAERLGRLLAISDLLGAHESMRWWNLRFLADSATGRFIVLPQSAHAGDPLNSILALGTGAPITFPTAANTITGRFLGDPAVYTRYLFWLDSLSNPGWLDSLLVRHEDAVQQYDRMVRGEFPQHRFDPEVLRHNVDVIRLMVHPKEPVLAYARTGGPGRMALSLANVHDLPMVIHGHVLGPDTILWPVPMNLAPEDPDRPLLYVRKDIEVPTAPSASMAIVTSVLGARERIPIECRTSGMHIAAP